MLEANRLALRRTITSSIEVSLVGAAVGKHARWPLWTQVLDGISDEELAKGNPDITDLVLSAKTGWPSRISRQFTNDKPTDQQQQKAQLGLNAVFSRYCP